MSRVVNTNSPGKRRNQHMRAGAELLRRLSQKPAIDDEARDMMAALVFSLRGVEESLEDATDAWEKRDYWMKAEQFRQKWMWVGTSADELDAILRSEDWGRLPVFMINILPNYSEITINKFTRDSDLWDGMYKKFQAERSR
jgi:hypothetical protein